MQGTWRKVGAAIGSAVILGATFAGAAFAAETAAATKSLGDYKDLMVASDGSISGLFVLGANAATADVISAMDMAAWVSNQQVAGAGDSSGQITITPLTTSVKGVKRHIEYDQNASRAYEFGSAGTTTDKIGPAGWASGDGVVDFLYSNKEKGPMYFNGTEYKWHEEVALTLANINASRDILDTNAGDKYDEVFVSTLGNTITYKYQFDTPVPAGANGLVGKKMWFMGKEMSIISARENDVVKLGATDSEVLLTTANPTTTVGGVDVTLGGIFSTGTSGTYKAKVTITNGGTTETKYILSSETDTVAGIEIYVKNAVVTTSGTNEGEAQLIVGAGITKLEDNGYLKKGDGTETTWQVILDNTNTAGFFLDDIVVRETTPYTTTSGSTKVLKPGDSIKFPTGLFSLKYTGSEDRYGIAPQYVDVDLMPTTIDLNLDGDQDLAVQISTPGGNYIKYLDNASVTKTADKIWLNTSTGGNASNGTWWYKDDTKTSTQYGKVTTSSFPNAPYVELTPQNLLVFNFTVPNGNYAQAPNKTYGRIYINEPALYIDAANKTIIVEYNSTAAAVGAFTNMTASNCYYVYTGGAGGSTGGTASDYAACSDSSVTGQTRDFITKWGSYIDSVGTNLVSLKVPKEQLYATVIFGTSGAATGKSTTVSPGETTTIGGTTVNVTGAVSGGKTVTLPASLAKLDSEVTAADKSGYTLVLVGGPKVNTLVNELQTTNKLAKTIGAGGDISAKGAGVIELISDAWGTGKYAVVVAGADRAGTAKAAKVLAKFDSNKALLADQTAYIV